MAICFLSPCARLLFPLSTSSTLLSARNLRRLDRCLVMVSRNRHGERHLGRFRRKRTCYVVPSSLRGLDSGEESDEESVEEEEAMVASSSPGRWDALGLGQAMVDFSGIVDDDFLKQLDIEKGTRKVINHEERGRVLRAMDGCSYKAAAGGSLSNTLVALARLGSVSHKLTVAMAGSVGNDPLGGFYRSKLQRANVSFLSKPIKDGTTGTVIVLTTPDAQRTMLAYPGTSSTVNYDRCLANLVGRTRLLFIEGYLLENPGTVKAVSMACEHARSQGALVAVSASDVSCIERSYEHFWYSLPCSFISSFSSIRTEHVRCHRREIIGNYADILFSNANEARSLCNPTPKDCPMSTARYLSHFVPLVSVTDGRRGSYIGVKGEAVYIPPSRCVPVDTCGAGDAYASGILYGVLRGVSDLKGMGMVASKVAAVVVAQRGTRLRAQDAAAVLSSLGRPVQSWSSDFCSDVESDHISSC